jgi:plastocyanin
MRHTYATRPTTAARLKWLHIPLLILCLFSTDLLYADASDVRVIDVQLGDYRFKPDKIQLVTGQPVILRLTNTDLITPHNFSLDDPSDGLDVNVDVSAGDTVDVKLLPLFAGSHTFYCRNKLLFMDSHREKGMAGTLIVAP